MTRDMNKTLMRILSIALLMMISIGAWADVKVIYGEKGTELQADKDGTITIGQKEGLTGGTIVITQVAQRDGTTKVTLAVTPSDGYTLAKDSLEVYAVAPADISSTRAVTASDKLDLTSDDFKDASQKRTYTTSIDSNLALWLKSASFQTRKREGAKGPGDVTYTYYALHANGKGYMKQCKGVVYNDNTFRYENAYDGYGSSMWVYSSEGYLQQEMYYLNVINGKTLVLSTTPETKWELVDDGTKKRFQMEGSTKILGYNSGSYPILDENPTNKYAACTLTVTEEGSKWEGPKDVSFTVQSPQLVTYLRTYYLRNITVTIDKNDAGTENAKVVDKKNSRCYCSLTYKSTTNSDYDSKWNINSTTGVIYNTTTGQVKNVDATYEVAPLNPIVKATHPATDQTVTLTLNAKSLAPSDTKKYLLFNTQDDNYRFLKATTSLSENDLLPVNGNKAELTETVNEELAWDVEVDDEGYYSFKNVETGRYFYYDATDYTVSDYGAVKIGSTDLGTDTRYKFRLYGCGNRDPFGGCQYIIPFEKQFAVFKSDGTVEELPFALYMNTSNSTKIASIVKAGDNAKWKLYTYEWQYRLWSDYTIIGEKEIYTAGFHNYTATTWISRNIKDSPNNSDYCTLSGSKTKTGITYTWQLTGLDDYVTTTDVLSDGTSTLTADVTLPPGTRNGTLKVTANISSPFSASKNTSIPITLYNLNPSFTEIDDLSGITDPDGLYRLKGNSTYSSSNKPSVTTFRGTLDGGNHTISRLTAPLFETIDGGTVRNLMMDNITVSSGDDNGNTGAIACEAKGTARIYNCGILASESTVTTDENGYTHIAANSSTVSGTNYVGGLVGLLDDESRVINCFSYADITGGDKVGGIVGYNNYETKSTDLKTMVMNCMFYGDITGGSNVAPIYNGKNIDNLQDKSGLNTYNYYAYTQLTTKTINTYNCALAVEDKYLNRFEFYRLLLNSNKKLAAFYVTGNAENADMMAKWVLETADRTISDPMPYPVLKAQGYYPSIVNPDITNAPDSATIGRNHGGKLGKTLLVSIATSKSDGGQTWPSGASITTTSLTLQRTDKDEDRFNFNYDKVQLPYYDEVGEGNYTGNRVVTGWKITAITPVDDDPYTASNYDYTKKYSENPEYYEFPNYNFADRHSSNKDLYTVSKRVFAQGAYFDVPYGVTAITIEPYWAKCAYLSDPNYDVVYKSDDSYSDRTDVTATGTQVTVGTTFFDGQGFTTNTTDQRIEKTIANALGYISSRLEGFGPTVYDNAVVLVGNFHQAGVPSNGTNPFTIMSVDLDKDHEPDYSMIYHHSGRVKVCPIRYDFLNIPGTAQAQKPNGSNKILNGTIYKTNDWFEITNTSSMYFTQFEYENIDNQDSYDNRDRKYAPLILQGGIFDQFVSTKKSNVDGKVIYIHVGGNAWFHEFGMGTHSDGSQSTPHVPVSVTGGDYDGFYLTGTYNANAGVRTDSAECYISGGRFGELAGASQEQINGNVTWQIYNADITSFFGGGTNDAKPITGTITTDIIGSHVTTFCGGPKFGNMSTDKAVTTTATDCTFGTFFGAGYGGNSYSRKKYNDAQSYNWTTYEGYYTSEKGKYYNGTSTACSQSGTDYGKKGPGVATDFDYEFFVWSGGQTGARIFVKFVSFSLAQCDDVSSTLTNCTVTGNFYGGGSLGKVAGDVTSTLTNCTVGGNVFGAGYSASLPTIKVRDSGFSKAPNYNKNSGMFEPAVFSGTTEYTWKHVDSYPSEGGNGFDGTQVITTQDLNKSNLGTVTGHVDLTLDGNTRVEGSVYGGGDESYVNNSTTPANAYTTVTLKGNTTVNGNVFGGGNHGVVSGSTTVNIQE